MKDGPKLRASNPLEPKYNDYGVLIPAKNVLGNPVPSQPPANSP